MRDLRDPLEIGTALLEQAPMARSAYGAGIPLSEVYDVHVGRFRFNDWTGDGFMSSNPAEHHSQTKQQPGGRRDYW